MNTYDVGARPVLCCGSKAWTARKEDERRYTSAEIFFEKNCCRCLLNDNRNELITEEIKITPIPEYL
jgi:hypothetical protein